MEMDLSQDRLVVKIRLRRREDVCIASAGLVDSFSVTTIRHLSERKLASRDCSLHRALLIQNALPFLEPPAPAVAVCSVEAAELPWEREPPSFDNAHTTMLPDIHDDHFMGPSSMSAETASYSVVPSLPLELDWSDHGRMDFSVDAEPNPDASLAFPCTLLSPPSARSEDEGVQRAVVVSQQDLFGPESDEEEEEEMRALFRKFREGTSDVKKRRSQPEKRSRRDEDDEEEGIFSTHAQAEPLKCNKPTRTSSPCGLTRRSSSCSSPFAVLSLV